MERTHENKKLGMVPRAVALAVALVLTGVVAAGFASATERLPFRFGGVSLISVHN